MPVAESVAISGRSTAGVVQVPEVVTTPDAAGICTVDGDDLLVGLATEELSQQCAHTEALDWAN